MTILTNFVTKTFFYFGSNGVFLFVALCLRILFLRIPHRHSDVSEQYSYTSLLRLLRPVLRTRFTTILNSSGIQFPTNDVRSEEHTSELQSQFHLVCRPLLVQN